jgi:hypothetical protein
MITAGPIWVLLWDGGTESVICSLRLFTKDDVWTKAWVERSDKIGKSSVSMHIHGNRSLAAGADAETQTEFFSVYEN